MWMDLLGLWSPAAHDTIFKYAFSDLLSHADIDRLQQSSRAFDRRTQSAEQSYLHSMRQRDESVVDALGLRDKFIVDTLVEARRLARSGERNAALDKLGEACHPIQDSSSPMHTTPNNDPREWNPLWPFGHSPDEHIGKETVKDLTPEILIRQKVLLNNLYDEVFGP